MPHRTRVSLASSALTILATAMITSFAVNAADAPPPSPAPVTPPTPPSSKPFFKKPFLLGAHRGGASVWPESTIEAFTHAAKQWPDALLETDARLTADGQVVLCHDETLDRTTDATGPIAQKTLAELKQLDAGYRFTTDEGKTFPYRGKGIKMATLGEVLKALPNCRFLVEFKNQEGVVEAVVKILKDTKAEDRVLLASFVPQLMQKAKELEPTVARCYDFATGADLLKRLQDGSFDSYAPAADVLSLDTAMLTTYKLTPEVLQRIRKKGIYLQLHTINDEPTMRMYLDQGVDSILSDRPDLLAKVIAEWKKSSNNAKQ